MWKVANTTLLTIDAAPSDGILFDTDNFEHLPHIWLWVIRGVSVMLTFLRHNIDHDTKYRWKQVSNKPGLKTKEHLCKKGCPKKLLLSNVLIPEKSTQVEYQSIITSLLSISESNWAIFSINRILSSYFENIKCTEKTWKTCAVDFCFSSITLDCV